MPRHQRIWIVNELVSPPHLWTNVCECGLCCKKKKGQKTLLKCSPFSLKHPAPLINFPCFISCCVIQSREESGEGSGHTCPLSVLLLSVVWRSENRLALQGEGSLTNYVLWTRLWSGSRAPLLLLCGGNLKAERPRVGRERDSEWTTLAFWRFLWHL